MTILDRFALRSGSICFALALTAGALACTDDGTDDVGDETTGDGDGDATGDGDPSGDGDGDTQLLHSVDIQPIWEANCVTACHVDGGSAALTLVLSGDAYANIVNVTSTQAPGKSLVEPGNSADSYLVAKLRDLQMEAGGLGGRMPAAPAEPLDEATIATIEAWIDAGAAP